jgi:hypothetical protein
MSDAKRAFAKAMIPEVIKRTVRYASLVASRACEFGGCEADQVSVNDIVDTINRATDAALIDLIKRMDGDAPEELTHAEYALVLLALAEKGVRAHRDSIAAKVKT